MRELYLDSHQVGLQKTRLFHIPLKQRPFLLAPSQGRARYLGQSEAFAFYPATNLRLVEVLDPFRLVLFLLLRLLRILITTLISILCWSSDTGTTIFPSQLGWPLIHPVVNLAQEEPGSLRCHLLGTEFCLGAGWPCYIICVLEPHIRRLFWPYYKSRLTFIFPISEESDAV